MTIITNTLILGSGKTICAEIAMMRVFRDTPNMKVVYIGTTLTHHYLSLYLLNIILPNNKNDK